MSELAARGHRVSYAIRESFAPMVAAGGAAPLVVESPLPEETAGEQWPTDPAAGMHLFLHEARVVLPQLEAALADDRPDAVCYDIGGYAGRALAQRWGLPLLQLSPSIVGWEGYEEDMGEALAFLDEPAGIAYRRDVDDWLGIDLDWRHFVGHPPRCAALVPEAMQPHAERVDHDVVTFVGPALDRRPQQEEWPAPERPLLVVSLGSAYNDRPQFFRDVIAAMDGLDWQVAMSVGPHVDPAELGAVPANVAVRSWLPQLSARRGVRHPRRHGRLLGGPLPGCADGRGAAGGGPVRQRGPAGRARGRRARAGRGGHAGPAARCRAAGVRFAGGRGALPGAARAGPGRRGSPGRGGHPGGPPAVTAGTRSPGRRYGLPGSSGSTGRLRPELLHPRWCRGVLIVDLEPGWHRRARQ